MNSERLGIVIPTYKEHETIAPLIEAITKALDPMGTPPRAPDLMIAVVDDSPDYQTVEAVRRLALPNVSVLHRTEKGGRGSAVIAGIKDVLDRGATRIVEMDSDFSHPPGQIPSLIAEARERNLDLLIASRYLPESRILNWPLTRRLFSKLSNWLARRMLGIPVKDYTNGFRCYSERAAHMIVSTCGRMGKGFISLSEILVNLWCRDHAIGETPTVFTNRVRGESSVNLNEITNAFMGLWKIYGLKVALLKEKKHVQTTPTA